MSESNSSIGSVSDSPPMRLNELQQQVDDWIRTLGVRYFEPLTNLAQLVEEVGEVARVLSRTAGQQSVREGQTLASLDDELADVLFVVVCLANQHGIDLDAAMRRNLRKKTDRDADRHLNNPKLRDDVATPSAAASSPSDR